MERSPSHAISRVRFPWPPLVLVVAGLLVTAYAYAAMAAPPREELKDLRDRIGDLQKELAAAEESRGEAADSLKESERAISDANRRLYELAGRLKLLNGELAELSDRIRRTEATIHTQRQQLSELLYRLYVDGRGEALSLVLSGRDPNEVARQLHYLTYVTRARAELLDGLKENLAALESLTAETKEKRQAVADVQSEQLAERSRLEREKANRAEVLQRLSRDIARQRREIGTLKRDETRLAKLVERLSRIITKRKPASPSTPGERLKNERVPDAGGLGGAFRSLKGKLALPVKGELAGRFGSPRSDSGLSWKGIFIRAPEGESVRAVAAGKVVFADWLRGFGNLLIVDHGEGYMSLYGNNESLYRQVGDDIRSGDAIASVGTSGGSPNSGLYFEMRFQGKPFDPLQWVSLR